MQQPQTDDVINPMREQARDLTAEADEAMHSARERLDDAVESMTERLRDAADYADRQVQNNPWTAVGASFGLGVVLGALVTLAARR
jgi:ElaB/YqjD/DUF883 family membrane-anchored ribosome-binding protein